MDTYIRNWLNIIEGMNNTNTYKLAWGRAIVEISYGIKDLSKESYIIHFDEISNLFLKYYWNQTYFFNLKQGPYSQTPTIQRIVEEMINEYKSNDNESLPAWFDNAKETLKRNPTKYYQYVYRTIKVLKKDVSYRFRILNNKIIPLYKLNLEKQTIEFTNNKLHCYRTMLLSYHSYSITNGLNY